MRPRAPFSRTFDWKIEHPGDAGLIEALLAQVDA
jgi:hypothetical protein